MFYLKEVVVDSLMENNKPVSFATVETCGDAKVLFVCVYVCVSQVKYLFQQIS